MVLPLTGPLTGDQIYTEFNASYTGTYGALNWKNMINYRSRVYYSAALGTRAFPAGAVDMVLFYGASPDDEWAVPPPPPDCSKGNCG